jgi:hypothetical protein
MHTVQTENSVISFSSFPCRSRDDTCKRNDDAYAFMALLPPLPYTVKEKCETSDEHDT